MKNLRFLTIQNNPAITGAIPLSMVDQPNLETFVLFNTTSLSRGGNNLCTAKNLTCTNFKKNEEHCDCCTTCCTPSLPGLPSSASTPASCSTKHYFGQFDPIYTYQDVRQQ